MTAENVSQFSYPFISVGLAHKATLTQRSFLIYCASPSVFLIIPDSSTRALWQLLAERPSGKAGKLGEIADEFCLRSISIILVGFFNMS
jgi:hypothetical protein